MPTSRTAAPIARSDVAWPTWLTTSPFVDWSRLPALGPTLGATLSNLLPDAESTAIRVEEFTEGDQLVVRAELPGIDPEQDVEVAVADHMLRIRAERRQSHTEENGNGFRSEFCYGKFTRAVRLPDGASEQDVSATYRDGILEVRVPVAAQFESRKVAIARS